MCHSLRRRRGRATASDWCRGSGKRILQVHRRALLRSGAQARVPVRRACVGHGGHAGRRAGCGRPIRATGETGPEHGEEVGPVFAGSGGRVGWRAFQQRGRPGRARAVSVRTAVQDGLLGVESAAGGPPGPDRARQRLLLPGAVGRAFGRVGAAGDARPAPRAVRAADEGGRASAPP